MTRVRNIALEEDRSPKGPARLTSQWYKDAQARCAFAGSWSQNRRSGVYQPV
jgi:hypothetical protein